MIFDSSVVNCRIIVIGNAHVGKTSLVNRLINNEFDPNQASTIGATHQFVMTEVEGTKLQVQIWDTAGEEKFKSLGPIYYRNSIGALVVFDETDKESYENIDDWIRSFTDVSNKNAVIAIAANKSDVEHKEVNYNEAKEWAESNGYLISETSAKDGKGIVELFSKMSPLLLEKIKEAQSSDCTQGSINIDDVSPQGGCC